MAFLGSLQQNNEKGEFMFKHKRIVLLVAGLFLLAGCKDPSSQPTSKERVRLSVWGAIKEKPLYEKHAVEFQALYPDIDFSISYADVGEADAATHVLQDVSTAADVFFFADDQLPLMQSREVIAKLPERYANKVRARDIDTAVLNASSAVDEELYAFPATNDNGYVLIYNKDFLTETDVQTLEGIMAKTNADHELVIDMGNGYYATSFIQYISEIVYNPTTKLHTTNFNNQASLDALQGVSDILKPKVDKGFKSDNFNGVALDDLSDENGNKVIAAVTGVWNYDLLKEKIGDKLGAAKLPTYKNVKGETIQWGSFAGSKLVGVKSSSNKLLWALAFADYITDEAAQRYRFQTNGWGPSNKNLLDDDELLAEHIMLKALSDQMPYAISQARSVGSRFWDNAAIVGKFLIEGPASPESPQTLKDTLDAFVLALTTE
ncbi:MAG: hypothetical protein BWY30_00466 [Tenericutes bacterium ADurb.Bin239]|nr:MAG: hypothetical protein BWY30_00466 [Tenericutes bacterium ADurb.Bin239]